MVLMNLAYIPDDIIKSLSNFDHGWSKQFKQLMDDYNSKRTIAK